MNLQQIPSKGEAKEIRRLFGAGPGNVLLSSDFSQQEPRCLAWLSGDTSMQNAYFTGKDLYSTMAAEAFHTTYENCLEFYLDEMVIKQIKQILKERKEEHKLKVYY